MAATLATGVKTADELIAAMAESAFEFAVLAVLTALVAFVDAVFDVVTAFALFVKAVPL